MTGSTVKTFDLLVEKIKASEKPYDLEKIPQAYKVAEKAHEGQKRSSGDPYITHPLAVAAILLDYCMDTDTICAALLHDTVEDTDVTLDDLQHFSAGLHDIGIHPRSQARILSGIKSFFHFLVLADYLEGDPSELLESPKIGFKLPEVLTVAEIDTIISTIDLSKPEGQRNRAILETLYC